MSEFLLTVSWKLLLDPSKITLCISWLCHFVETRLSLRTLELWQLEYGGQMSKIAKKIDVINGSLRELRQCKCIYSCNSSMKNTEINLV